MIDQSSYVNTTVPTATKTSQSTECPACKRPMMKSSVEESWLCAESQGGCGTTVVKDKYEELSQGVCEYCSSTENVTSEGGWIKTLCAVCRKGNP